MSPVCDVNWTGNVGRETDNALGATKFAPSSAPAATATPRQRPCPGPIAIARITQAFLPRRPPPRPSPNRRDGRREERPRGKGGRKIPEKENNRPRKKSERSSCGNDRIETGRRRRPVVAKKRSEKMADAKRIATVPDPDLKRPDARSEKRSRSGSHSPNRIRPNRLSFGGSVGTSVRDGKPPQIHPEDSLAI